MLTEIVEPCSTATIVAPAEAADRRTDKPRRMQPHSDVPVLGRDTQANKTNWVTTSFMSAFHVLALVALFMFTWKAFFCFLGLWVVSINMGIGMGYHRLLTHRGYRTPRWLEYFLSICGTLALEGGPIFWVATHRVHHQLTDREGDPHTPHDGGWWSHAGWILSGDALHHETALMARYAPDLAKDRFQIWLSKYHYVPMIVVGLALLAFGGWSCVMWGIFLRVTLGLHATWLVNSATHMWGSRRFSTRDESRNNWWVALITGGEGWHNNHHAHPVSVRHGLTWWEFDMNFYGIWLLKKIGLASNVKVAQFDPHDPRPAGVS
jgi:stearoyl-CoA desaturase (delta-9 desaturase)